MSWSLERSESSLGASALKAALSKRFYLRRHKNSGPTSYSHLLKWACKVTNFQIPTTETWRFFNKIWDPIKGRRNCWIKLPTDARINWSQRDDRINFRSVRNLQFWIKLAPHGSFSAAAFYEAVVCVRGFRNVTRFQPVVPGCNHRLMPGGWPKEGVEEGEGLWREWTKDRGREWDLVGIGSAEQQSRTIESASREISIGRPDTMVPSCFKLHEQKDGPVLRVVIRCNWFLCSGRSEFITGPRV